MYPCFEIDGISAETLLHEWRWLVRGDFTLLAVNAFGDLFLEDFVGIVHRLDITNGKISQIANSAPEFQEAAKGLSKQKEWLLIDDARTAAEEGHSPVKGQCIGAKIPWIFKESADAKGNLYVADLFEFVSFMGDLHKQVSDVPDGGQVRIKVQPNPKEL